MSSIEKSTRRQKQNHKARHGMKTTGRSVFTIIQAQIKRSKKKAHD